MASTTGNLEAVARAACARLHGRQCAPDLSEDAEVERHWHVVAAQLEAGLGDDTGAEIAPFDVDLKLAAYRDWRKRHHGYVVPSPRPDVSE